MVSGFCLGFLSITAKCLGMLRKVFSGKLASTMAMEQPITIIILEGSKKFPICSK